MAGGVATDVGHGLSQANLALANRPLSGIII